MPAFEINPLCPPSAPFFGFMGAAVALIFASACPPLPPLPSAPRGGVCVRGSRRHQSVIPGRFLCADLGAAYGTAKSGVGVSSMGVMKPDLIMKSIIPVVMAGVLGIYGLIIAVIIANQGARPSPDPQGRPFPPPPTHRHITQQRTLKVCGARWRRSCFARWQQAEVLRLHRLRAPCGWPRVRPQWHGRWHC